MRASAGACTIVTRVAQDVPRAPRHYRSRRHAGAPLIHRHRPWHLDLSLQILTRVMNAYGASAHTFETNFFLFLNRLLLIILADT
jgi:hypothetical protein